MTPTPPPNPSAPNTREGGDAPSSKVPGAHGPAPTERDERRRVDAARRVEQFGRMRLEDLRQLHVEITTALEVRACRACPGVHRPSNHRDGKAPWCRFCGRTALAEQVASPSTTVARAAAGQRPRPERTPTS